MYSVKCSINIHHFVVKDSLFQINFLISEKILGPNYGFLTKKTGKKYPEKSFRLDEPRAGERMERKTVILPGIKSTLDIGNGGNSNGTGRSNVTITCRDDPQSEATILLSLALLGIFANLLLMLLIIIRGKFSRWHHS